MHDEKIPAGLCQCGCGEATALRNGKHPQRFRKGHNRRVPGLRESHRAEWERAGVEYGYCLCGCGERTPLAVASSVPELRVRKEPCRYIDGHQNRRGWRVTTEDRGYLTPCLIWQGCIGSHGYGSVSVGGRQTRPTHCVAYERVNGPIPDGLELDHLCRVRACCNPDHLEPVTHAENVRRGAATKLTREQMAEILEPSPLSQEAVGAIYGISQRRVSQIRIAAGIRTRWHYSQRIGGS